MHGYVHGASIFKAHWGDGGGCPRVLDRIGAYVIRLVRSDLGYVCARLAAGMEAKIYPKYVAGLFGKYIQENAEKK